MRGLRQAGPQNVKFKCVTASPVHLSIQHGKMCVKLKQERNNTKQNILLPMTQIFPSNIS